MESANSESANGGAVPITILTGFLGAGKTALLNRILNSDLIAAVLETIARLETAQ